MKRKVLIASADKYSNILLSDKLSKSYEVHTVDDGKAASEFLLKSEQVDLLICDYMMPNIDGLALAKKIKGSYSISSMKILMITTFFNQSLFAEIVSTGVDSIIEKPYEVTDIEARITRILQ